MPSCIPKWPSFRSLAFKSKFMRQFDGTSRSNHFPSFIPEWPSFRSLAFKSKLIRQFEFLEN